MVASHLLGVLSLAALVLVACAEPASAPPVQVPSGPPTLVPSSPAPEHVANTFEEAMHLAMPMFNGSGSTVTFHEIESISYVETTIELARRALNKEWRVGPDDPIPPGTKAWAIVACGRFREGRNATVTVSTSQALVIAGWPGVAGYTSNNRYDLSIGGNEIVIPVGQFPEIDAVRVGAPPRPRFTPRPLISVNLATSPVPPVGGIAEVSITVGQIPSEYAGYQWQLQWDDATLDFVSASENAAGHGAELCAPASGTTTTNGVPAGIEWVGQGAGCLLNTRTTMFEGELTRVTVRCIAPGSAEIALVGPAYDPRFGTMLIAPDDTPIEAAIGPPITLTCTER